MKKNFLYHLREVFYNRPFLFSIFVAFILRTMAAWANYGPGAIDDYLNVIDPALQILQTGEVGDIPPWRFYILPYMFATFMSPLWFLGIERADTLVAFGYNILGIISLLQIWAIYEAGKRVLSHKWLCWLTLFSAVQFLTPFIATRAYLASFAVIPLTWALAYSVRDLGSSSNVFWLGFFIALSVFFRFSLTPIYFFVGAALIVKLWRERFSYRPLIFYVLGGISVGIFMIISEVATGRLPLSTILGFIAYNYKTHITGGGYEAMSWYAYFGMLLYVFIPPISVWFLWPFLKSIKAYVVPTMMLVAFLLFHSMVDFKLDRYIIPVLPIFIFITFVGIEKLAKYKFWRYSFYTSFALNALLAPMVAVSGSQLAQIDGVVNLAQKEGIKITYRVTPWRPAYYGYDKIPPRRADKKGGKRQSKSHAREEFREILSQLSDQKRESKGFWLLTFLPLDDADKELLKNQNIKCNHTQTFWPSLLERVVIWANPKHNERRRETLLYKCRK